MGCKKILIAGDSHARHAVGPRLCTSIPGKSILQLHLTRDCFVGVEKDAGSLSSRCLNPIIKFSAKFLIQLRYLIIIDNVHWFIQIC